jgi:RNA polymerase sigma-70 factor (ECF subfamily)
VVVQREGHVAQAGQPLGALLGVFVQARALVAHQHGSADVVAVRQSQVAHVAATVVLVLDALGVHVAPRIGGRGNDRRAMMEPMRLVRVLRRLRGRGATAHTDQSEAPRAPNRWHGRTGRHRRWHSSGVGDMGAMRLGRERRSAAHHAADSDRGSGGDRLGALLKRAGRGDQQAFGELYDELSPLVYGVVLKVVRDPSQSEEVTQEVFVELWRLATRYDVGRGSVRSWASTVAHRRAIDRVRSEQSSRDRVERQATHATTDHDDVVASVESNLDQVRVRRALAQLSSLQREAVELAYFGGHTYREVAVLLDVAEGTVKTRIRDGMIRLRDELGGAS